MTASLQPHTGISGHTPASSVTNLPEQHTQRLGCAALQPGTGSKDGPGKAVCERQGPHAPRPPLIAGKPLVRGIFVPSVDYFNQNWYQF
jgi:hypothetical protein